MTTEHLQCLLEDEAFSSLLAHAASMLAKGSIPRVARDVLRLGRLTALSKPGGRVRGITTGEVMRRLVAKTLAQTYAKVIDQACSPFQYALSTRAGTECIVHTLRAAFEADQRAAIVGGGFRSDFPQSYAGGPTRGPGSPRYARLRGISLRFAFPVCLVR
jgi:hypothetical protein